VISASVRGRRVVSLDGTMNTPPQGSGNAQLVVRNTLFLVLSQFVTAPLSLLVNAVMGRYLGPEDFGLLYLLFTITTLVFIVVEWGQQATLTSMVARSPERSGVLLGSALAFRLPLTLLAYGVSAASLLVLGHPVSVQRPYLLVFVCSALATTATVIGAILRGHERISLLVRINIGTALLQAVLPVGALLLGLRFSGLLWANIAVAGCSLGISSLFLRLVVPGTLKADWEVAKGLARTGTTFMLLGAVLALQPYVDAMILARLAPGEVVGWYAAALKFLGIVLFPSTTLAAALYPTLSRLHAESAQAWADLTRSSLETVAIFAVPASLGCLLFADVGISLFSRTAFGPAADNLRMLSPYVFLVYFNIVLGTSLTAAGKQVRWAWAQSGCVGVSLIADPLLVPLFQRRFGNGGLGVGAAMVTSEVMVAVAAVLLAPRGLVDRGLIQTVARTTLAGAAMCAAALVTRGIWWPPSMIAALAAYAATLFAVGGVGAEQRRLLTTVVASRLRRKT
jgi:O-antigen/teichoic acid export membrane protein